jgi:hypothetical protein
VDLFPPDAYVHLLLFPLLDVQDAEIGEQALLLSAIYLYTCRVTKAAAALGVFIHQEQSSTHGLM